MDERFSRMRNDRTAAPAAGRVLAIAVLSCLCVTAQLEAISPPEQGSSKDFRATVLDISGDTQRITVPLNRSVIIETTIETSRADVVASQIADVQPVSPTQLLVTGKAYGRTDVILWDKSNQQYMLDVTVELDLQRLSETLKKIDPQSSVEVRSIMGNIVLTGSVTSAERARRMEELANLFLPLAGGETEIAVQNHLDVAGEHQVLLRCVVAEVSRAAARELGVNGFLAGDSFEDAFLVNQLGGINPINIGAAADALVDQTIPFLTGSEGIPLTSTPTFSLGFPDLQMQLFIKAMAENSLLAVLAEPNLVAISGETASFLAGGEFPILVPQGNNTVSIDYREFGVRLQFTPVVKGQQLIRLRVRPEVSEIDPTVSIRLQGFDVPGLKTRAAETIVEVGNGQTIAIAGLLSEEIRGLASRIPGLGDVPVLGALFRSVRFQRNLSELVILVTPDIVAPLDAHQYVELPGRDIKDPSDFELYALGLLEGDILGKDDSPHDGYEGEHAGKSMASQPDEMSIHGPWGHAARGEAQ
ncbi:MAG: type II and III secretion system protein family protein [Planctomycetota bacterium]|jgi:pilus assembly protein CpaC